MSSLFTPPIDEYRYEEGRRGFPVEDPKAKKRVLNRESALRSRMKKKAYFENIEGDYMAMQKESNQLKLENVGLRAENQLLKRYLSYFENLFAKKSGVVVA